MAKISIGPTGREAINIGLGGNGEQRAGNTQARNAPVATTPPANAGNGQPNVTTQNNAKGIEMGAGPETVPETVGKRIELGGGPEGENGALGTGPREGQGTKPGPPVQTVPPHVELPILPNLFRGRHASHEPGRAEEARRNDNRDRPAHENHHAGRANQRRGLIRNYLRQNLHEMVLESRRATADQVDLQRLSQTVADRLSRAYNDPAIQNAKTLSLITQEISHLLARDTGQAAASPTAIPYDRALQTANLLLPRVMKETPAGFMQLTDRAMLDALVILQLCCDPGRFMKEMREITGHKPSILPEGIPWSMFRDTGLLAATLMREGTVPRSTAQIEAAVQRFFTMLLANGSIGVLLAAVRLTADARAGRVPSGGIATLVRIYELIAQLMIVTERAMKEAADSATRKPVELRSTEKALAFGAALEPAESEAALRQYLAFNPSAQADSGASAFYSEHTAETSTRIAVDSSQREIIEWINSGRHRFVTEADIGKPVGVVIDGNSDECFTASWVRVVLVRDGSVLGWHVLRSSLVG